MRVYERDLLLIFNGEYYHPLHSAARRQGIIRPNYDDYGRWAQVDWVFSWMKA